MSFGGFGGGFGASSSPFGASSPSPFGQQTPAFGQASSPFGATTTTGVFGQSQPAFGASPAPAFGAAPAFGQSQPAFGASSAPAFGATSAFGAKPAFGGFGATAGSPFGASSTPAFGQSAAAFGASSAPAFGASPFGGSTFGASQPAFGATSAPAFGAASTPAFGQSNLTAFGSTTFGQAAPAAGFGGGFGGGARGTRAVAWRKTQEQDTSGSSGTKSATVVFFNSISCMPEYANKSVEELRFEDYADGCKGNTGAASPAGGAFGASPAFGASSSPFGAPTSSPAFGAASSPAFGASAPAFGATSAPAFGGFGATSAPAFGASSAPAFGGFGATTASPFGGASPSPFGQSAPAFGATSTPAFGATSSPAFGATSAPAFGGFGATSTPAFGATSAPAFGASPAPAFGAASSAGFGFGASSTPAFGAASAPAFGAQSSPGFGFGASSAPAFGAASAPAFGTSSASLFGAASTPAFGGGTSLFGAATQQPAAGFGFGAASTPAFGAAPTPAFGASSASLFGAASTPAFGGTSLFGASQAAPTFSFAPAGQAAAAPAAGALVPAQQVQAPGVATSPYGVLPEPPKVSPAPEYKVGLTQRPAGLLSGGPPRPAALITPRSITPRSGVRMRPRRSMSATRMSKSPADFLAAAANVAGTPGSAVPGADGRSSATPNGSIFVPRENPRRLFVRDPLPSTEGAATISASPAGALGGTPGRPPLRTPGSGSGLRITPGRRGDGGAAEAAGASGSGDFVLAENGFGPAPSGSADGELSDGQLAALLPSLKQPDYYTEPSLQQLAAMARDDPASLASVANFVVGRRGVGSVRWLEPTDVRGLDLDGTVQMSKGSIEVYLDDSTKPEVGHGLNKPAEVTMLRVHKIDKETGKPSTDPEAIDRYARRLKKVTAEQGARFVSYDATSGTWKFEVEHFSKYGLDSEEDSDEEELQAYGVRRRAAAAAAARQAAAQRGGEGGERAAGEEDEDGMEDSRGRGADEADQEMEEDEEQDGQEPSFGALAAAAADGGLGGRRVLQVELPAQLGMEPEDLQRIRDGLYAGSRQPPAKQRRVLVLPQQQQLAVGARAAAAGEPVGTKSEFQKRQREALEAALVLHMQHSSPDPSIVEPAELGGQDGEEAAAEAAAVPQWRLRCRRQEELRKLTLAYIELCTAAAAKAQGAERTVLRHQASTWELLHVLFSAIEGEQAPGAAEGPAAMQEGEDGDELRLDRLAAFKRRAALSHWLRDRARPHVEAALRRGAAAAAGATTAADAVAAQLLALLSGHQLAAAAALAAATGNPRLASLLAQAGTKSVGAAELAEQLRVWEESGCEQHIAAGLRRVYQLLAGHVDDVVPAMQLDWRRALGVHLWYGCQPTATVAEALASYTAAVESGAAPPPLPLYSEQAAGSSSGAPAASGSAFDVAFELLRLHAVGSDLEASGSPAALQPLLARLLRPSGLTPDPLDYAFPWHLLSVLGAVGALPPAVVELPQAAAARMSFIAQLEAVGGLAHWAVYAALHIPDAAERARVVRELLQTHADEWANQPEVWAFLRDRLALPAAWLAEAQALRAHYCADDAGRLDQLLDAEDWHAAHALLCDLVAPRWVLAGELGRLAAVLDRLEPHAADVNAAGGTGAWEAGGGVYSAYLYLRELYATLGRSSSREVPAALSFPERMEAASRLAAMLQDASARWGLGGAAPEAQQSRRLDARPGGGAMQQAVYARMSAELSKWVTSDGQDAGTLLPTPGQERLAVGLRAMPHEATAAGLQMAAINLAQRALEEAEQAEEDPAKAQAQSPLQALTAARSFAAAFQSALDSDPAIRAAATTSLSTGLQDGFAAADERVSTVLSPENASQAFIGAGGYRQWIAGPEAAVRRLVADSLQLFKAPTDAAAGRIQAALQAAADAAAASLPAELPEHLREQLAQLAAASIASWAGGALGQLRLLLQAEQACPENESFVELQRQLSLLLSSPPAEEVEETASETAAPAAAPAAAEAKQAEGVEETAFFMGWLERLTSKGGWRKRWVVLEPRKGLLCYMKHAADRHPPTSFSLQGATVVDGPLIKPSRAGTVVRGSDPLVFHLSGALLVGTASTSIVTLRAHTASAKEAWLAQLCAAVAGTTTAAAETAKPAAAVLHRASTGGSEDAEASGAAQGGTGVPRKISTAVFAEEPSAAAAEEEHHEQAEDAQGLQEEEEEADGDPEAAAAAKLADEEALVADIAAQAARRSLRPGEQAVLEAALKAIESYVHAARGRLLSQAQKTLSTCMLLGRREAMDQALLAVVLPPGAAPPRADFNDDA
ncbi:nuclear pore complex NUP98A isoform X1 isoform B [Chlorella sorokiniana]|uniref:Nucleoporin autopeptidase n=1 Tax=Chlorella sorokiniana TaxID=3076 RepID=A0A2P6TXJ0_CHLSO|nr:nuclear pore complex NUP98A isoform X1 isoform B [Chlorella sorokiniana]|eukprot:PRW58789.1 nuclear pore complex NUP98A isoform X1 isoform B [Chlorella sorokiniana]